MKNFNVIRHLMSGEKSHDFDDDFDFDDLHSHHAPLLIRDIDRHVEL